MKRPSPIFIILIISLLILTASLSLWTVFTRSSSSTKPPAIQQSQSDSNSAQLMLTSQKSTYAINQPIAIQVILNPKNQPISNLDLLINFNPQILHLDSVDLGSFFTTPQEFAKTINNTKGRLIYSLGSFTSASEKNTIATLNFSPVSKSKTQISINPETVIVSQGNQIDASPFHPLEITIK